MRHDFKSEETYTRVYKTRQTLMEKQNTNHD